MPGEMSIPVRVRVRPFKASPTRPVPQPRSITSPKSARAAVQPVEGPHQQFRPAILQLAHEVTLESRGVAVEQGADIGRRDRPQSRALADLDEAQAGPEFVMRVEIEGVAIGPERGMVVGDIRRGEVAGLSRPSEQEPRRRVTRRDLQGLLGHLGRALRIALGETGLRIGVAPVGEEIAPNCSEVTSALAGSCERPISRRMIRHPHVRPFAVRHPA